jgi:aquaporin Z
MSKIFIAEVIGTAILVLFGCGAAVLMGAEIGMTGISLAFGLAIVAAAYGIGPISGAHLNPAVSFGAFLAGRMSVGSLATYVVAQLVGAVVGAGVLYLIASGKTGYDIAVNGLGQNGYGAGYLGEYSLTSALVFEAVMTFLFVTVILGATQDGAPAAMAGLAIGLTLAAINPPRRHHRDRRFGEPGAVLWSGTLCRRQGNGGPLGLHRGPAGRWGAGRHPAPDRSYARLLTKTLAREPGDGEAPEEGGGLLGLPPFVLLDCTPALYDASTDRPSRVSCEDLIVFVQNFHEGPFLCQTWIHWSESTSITAFPLAER